MLQIFSSYISSRTIQPIEICTPGEDLLHPVFNVRGTTDSNTIALTHRRLDYQGHYWGVRPVFNKCSYYIRSYGMGSPQYPPGEQN